MIPLVFLSCATVTFNVEHPPLVDLRGANSITVIPFEWNSNWDNADLAPLVTRALLNGIKRGSISIVDPYSQEKSNTRNYSRYADIYILGKIITVTFYDDVKTREDKRFSETIIITTITRTVHVDIEYTYYRSANNQVLGRFNKTAYNSDSIERTRRADERPNRNGSVQGTPRRNGRNPRRNIYRQSDEWTNRIAASAISGFADTMDNELDSWTTKEKRSIEALYSNSGGKTAQRDYKNGVLERQILTQGSREVEELFLNGRTLLRAVWENGVKISEERLP